MLPVILLGTERSGTNLLRRYVGSHIEIASPPPAGLIFPMAAYNHLYLSNRFGDHAMEQWVKVALALIDAHPADWEMTVSVNDLLSRINGDSHWDLFRALNEFYAEKENASIWLSKEPEAIHYFDDITRHFPNAKFIYLVRDGRDVAASMLRGGVHEQHIYGVAKRWYRDQVAGIELLESPSNRDRIHLVRYEDFIGNHESETLKIFDFIGCATDAAVNLSHKNVSTEKIARRSKLWENLSQPIKTDNIGNYRKSLKLGEVSLFESIAKIPLQYFGYSTETSNDWKLTSASSLQVKIETAFNFLTNYADKSVRREKRIRRKYRSVARKVKTGQSFS